MTVVPTRGSPPVGLPSRALESQVYRQEWWRRPDRLLALVALAHGVVPIVLLGTHWGFGFDETVYLSQINAHVPAGLFSAPRARGTTFVAAPVTLLTDSVSAVRIWLAALSAVLLFLAYRPWMRLRPGAIAPIAALLFSTIWSVAYYSFEAMPNEWVAFAVVGASGYTLQFLHDGRNRHLIWIVSAMALAALFRPSDAGFAAMGLVAACVFIDVPTRLRILAIAAAAVGAILGTSEWLVEAETRYGGITARIHAAQAEQGGGGLRFSGLAQARTLAGPLLCRAGCTADASVYFWLWWVIGGGLAVLSVVFARRCLRRGDELLPLVVGLATAAQYVLTVGYSAPRFLIPSYALLALPCASGVVHLRGRVRRGPPRVALTAALVAVLSGHAAIQADVILRHIKPSTAAYTEQMSADATRLHVLGVHASCILLGGGAPEPLAYATGCSDVPSRPLAIREAIAAGTIVVWIGSTAPPARYGSRTHRFRLPGPHPHSPLTAYIFVGSS